MKGLPPGVAVRPLRDTHDRDVHDPERGQSLARGAKLTLAAIDEDKVGPGLLGVLLPSPNRSRLLPTSVTLLGDRTLAIARFGWGGVGGGGRKRRRSGATTPRPPTPPPPPHGGGGKGRTARLAAPTPRRGGWVHADRTDARR